MKKKLSLILVTVLCALMLSSVVYAQDVTVNGKTFTINEDFQASDIPAGYQEAEISYEGTTMRGIANDADTQYKFYLTSSEDPKLNGWYEYLGEGKFAGAGESGISLAGGKLTIETPTDDIVIPDGIEQTELKIGNNTYTAYVPKDQEEDGLNSYLVFGTMDGTEHAWYLFNADDNMAVKTSIDQYGKAYTYEQDNKSLNSKLEKLNNKYNKNMRKAKYLFLVLCVCSMLFLFLMINAMMKRRHNRLDMEDRIIDLKLHDGRDTMKIGKKDLKKRHAADLKAMHRNDVDPSLISDEAPIKKKRPKKSKDDIDAIESLTSNNEERKAPKKKKPSKVEKTFDNEDDFFDDFSFDEPELDFKSLDNQMDDVAEMDDDDIEFVSLDL